MSSEEADETETSTNVPGAGTSSPKSVDVTVPRKGKEGLKICPKSMVGASLAVFTSGGDSQGMNAALRAVVRMGLYLGCRVYTIKEGYQGMVDGGDNICEAEWNTVSGIIQGGGTVIGSARCKEFWHRDGRLKAAQNLLLRNITNLVCIGGDGSLTGAYTFKKEWAYLVKELVAAGRVPKNKLTEAPTINIVGLVGSIDNDFCGTDMTIGADSALHRIVEAVDAVTATAQSHQRSFVIEVMGRRCGYLALVAGLTTEADWIFIPEWPSPGDWAELMCKKLSEAREQGQRTNIVIVAEGAIDGSGKAISAQQVKEVISKKLKFDTRVTVLGHVQRGGSPSAFDRLLGCRMGAEAVIALMEMDSTSEPVVISIDGNQMIRVPMMKCVELTKQVQAALDEQKFEQAGQLRGRSFMRNLEMYRLMTKMTPPKEKDNLSMGHTFNFAVMNVGSPSCGMNAAVGAFVRVGLYHNCRVFGVEDSFDGLIAGRMKEMKWNAVANWVMSGGSFLGTQRQTPEHMLDRVASSLKTFNIHGILIVGGFEAFHSALIMVENRDNYDAFCIPIVVLPCTISNNVPGTSFSLGSDTALNEICEQIDKIKQSATGTKRRVFIVETMGGYCGYLATLSALASGADNAYIFEEKFTVDNIKEDVQMISQKMLRGVQRYITLRSENASRNYTAQFIQQLFAEEGKNVFSTRVNVLGHSQQGGSPSPFDRNCATKMAARALEFLLEQANKFRQPDGSVHTDESDTVTLLGLNRRVLTFTPVEKLRDQTDFQHALPKKQWWLKLRPLMRILAKHDSLYEVSSVNVDYVLDSF